MKTSDLASERALDDIAKLCGCPEWDYPGQVVRDVERLKLERDKARATLERVRDVLEKLAPHINKWCEDAQASTKATVRGVFAHVIKPQIKGAMEEPV